MTKKRLNELIHKYLSGEATREEKREIEEWYESFEKGDSDGDDFFETEINKSFTNSLKNIYKKIESRGFRSIKRDPTFSSLKNESHKRKVRSYAIAAVILVLLVGSYFVLQQKSGQVFQEDLSGIEELKDFEPGGNKAVLTLGNGQRIVLDSSDEGLLSTQGNTKIIKLNAGELAYDSKNGEEDEEIHYNSISTPKGGQYQVVLSDGSKVWLNASSSIRFPTQFTGRSREVTMTGEAYFEVAPDKEKPFIVKKDGLEVKVLGTHFNVMAYKNDGEVQVTLLEGSINVKEMEQEQMLYPGEQAVVEKDGRINLSDEVELGKTMAWKNNLFWFEDNTVGEVMEQLARWYDIDIEIEGDIPDLLSGSIERDVRFSRVFEILQKTGSIHYRIEGERKVIINS